MILLLYMILSCEGFSGNCGGIYLHKFSWAHHKGPSLYEIMIIVIPCSHLKGKRVDTMLKF